ncbi:MAG: Fic family protein [Akkermansiaceae bacterium]|jgi:Fic family protein|nr:Fic family protein [Akkermansiaceae bacterium]
MKIPEKAPTFPELVSRLSQDSQVKAMLTRVPDDYRHWDELKHRSPPSGLTREQWWMALKYERSAQIKNIPLKDRHGENFGFCVPDKIAAQLHKIDLGAGGRIGMPEPVTNPDTRDQYLIRSLMDEAITSSQLEGAVTNREVAKDMLRSGRKPQDKSETMILNNYRTMRRIREVRERPLTPELVFEIHRMITDGTLDKPDATGRLRREDELVTIEDESGEIMHMPPPAGELPSRLQEMCNFANDTSPEPFIHPALRAIILHFWLAYDHPFLDGNGRTARALFYWNMLHSDYWLFEFISISDVLKRAPAKYYTAFLHTETDENDLTYFLLHQSDVIRKAIETLHAYIARKTDETRESQVILREMRHLNHRQQALVGHALRHPGTTYTIEGHLQSHGIAYNTARTDLLDLAAQGLLDQSKRGKKMVFHASLGMEQAIREKSI